MIWPDDFLDKVVIADAETALREIPDEQVQTCVTSPPYWGLRDYGVDGQIGLEETLEEYCATLVRVFREVRRVLKPDGTLWINLGDTYASGKGSCLNPGGGEGSFQQNLKKSGALNLKRTNKSDLDRMGLKPKDLVGIPWMVAFALRADGWYLRSDIIWSKPNPMPESVEDRPTKSHEYLFLLSKSDRYYYDGDAIREPYVNDNPNRLVSVSGWSNDLGAHSTVEHNKPKSHKGSKFNKGKTGAHQLGRASSSDREDHPDGKNKRSVWNITTVPYKRAHFATFPAALVNPCILAGSREGDIVLDPFGGSGTTAWRAKELLRCYIHIDLTYKELAEERLRQEVLFKG